MALGRGHLQQQFGGGRTHEAAFPEASATSCLNQNLVPYFQPIGNFIVVFRQLVGNQFDQVVSAAMLLPNDVREMEIIPPEVWHAAAESLANSSAVRRAVYFRNHKPFKIFCVERQLFFRGPRFANPGCSVQGTIEEVEYDGFMVGIV